MAEQDQSSKTEQPTSRRLQQGRERGQVAVSQDVKTWGVLTASAIAFALVVPSSCQQLMEVMIEFIETSDVMRIGVANTSTAAASLVLDVFLIISPLILLVMMAAAGATLAQTGFIWAPSRIAPELSRISIAKGFQRIFSWNGLLEFSKGLLKIGIVAAVFAIVAWPILRQLDVFPAIAPAGVIVQLDGLLLKLISGTAIVMMFVAGADYALQRTLFLQQMKMTQQEVRDEYKETEGDPHIKARIKQLRTERARKRMMAAVPDADVIITNPTHYAVALAYDMNIMPAPKLVAKGVDFLAQRIREIAENNDVPVVENPPLARALYSSVEVDDEVPPQHYEAVAKVIGYVMQLQRQKA
ncbi:MAG: flagellar biosynthesis protein FlhB [Hyphomicrobiales bacterium]|nr:flagellar biosynthesis protein FlhB [Hyphomicrobiales bacterium]